MTRLYSLMYKNTLRYVSVSDIDRFVDDASVFIFNVNKPKIAHTDIMISERIVIQSKY